jgi:hypothetical protein
MDGFGTDAWVYLDAGSEGHVNKSGSKPPICSKK